MYILDLFWEGLQSKAPHYSSQTRGPTEAVLHVRRRGVARWKASNPLFPAAPVAGVGALRVLQLYAVFTLSPERFCRFLLDSM